MKTSDFFSVCAFILIAPHMTSLSGMLLGIVFGVAALVMRYVGKD